MRMKVAIRFIVSLFFLIAGLVGLFLPVIPGLLFLLLGLLALSTLFKPFKDLFKTLEEKHPQLHAHLARWRERLFPD